MKTHYDVTLRGGLCGEIWWPVGAKCGIDLTVDFSREASRIVGDKVTLRDVISHIVCEKGGNFQCAQLTGDTEIIVTSRKSGRVYQRFWPITAFPSIADYVDDDSYSWDFNGDGDE